MLFVLYMRLYIFPCDNKLILIFILVLEYPLTSPSSLRAGSFQICNLLQHRLELCGSLLSTTVPVEMINQILRVAAPAMSLEEISNHGHEIFSTWWICRRGGCATRLAVAATNFTSGD